MSPKAIPGIAWPMHIKDKESINSHNIIHALILQIKVVDSQDETELLSSHRQIEVFLLLLLELCTDIFDGILELIQGFGSLLVLGLLFFLIGFNQCCFCLLGNFCSLPFDACFGLQVQVLNLVCFGCLFLGFLDRFVCSSLLALLL